MFRNLGRRRAAPRAPAAPVQALDRQTPRLLTARDFTAYTPSAGQLSRLAAFEVPRGEILELDTVRPFRLLVKAKAEVEVDADGSGDATIDLGALGYDLVKSARPAATLPGKNNPNVVVLDNTGAKVTIDAIDYDANEVDVSGLTPNGTDIPLTVYALVGNGEIKLRAIEPAGVDQRAVELYNDTLGALHEVDQAQGETAPVLLRGLHSRVPLGPKWLLAVEVDSAVPLSFAAASEPVLEIHGYRLPVNVTDPARLNAAVAGRLR